MPVDDQDKAPGSSGAFAGGEMGTLMHDYPWLSTLVGPMASWPCGLRTAVSICLSSPLPTIVFWGPQLVQFFNDPYRELLAPTLRPAAFARPARECCRETWESLGPILTDVLAGAECVRSVTTGLRHTRANGAEACSYTMSYSPIIDETGKANGVFCVGQETVGPVVAERRLHTLCALASPRAEASTAAEIGAFAAEVLGGNPHDIPFALLYWLDDEGQSAHLIGQSGMVGGLSMARPVIDLVAVQEDSGGSSIQAVVETGRAALLTNLAACSVLVPVVPGHSGPNAALVLPVRGPRRASVAGFLIAAINPLCALDDEYRAFFTVVAGQIATLMAGVRTSDGERRRAEGDVDLVPTQTVVLGEELARVQAQAAKERSELLAQAEITLRNLERNRNVFLSTAAHDLKNPLATIRGLAQLAQRRLARLDGRDTAQVGDLLYKIEAGTTRMMGVIGELMNVTRDPMDAMDTTVVLERQSVDLVALVGRVVAQNTGATSHHLQVKTSYPEITIAVDPPRIERVVAELLNNAIKYSLKGGDITIRLGKEQNGPTSEAVLAVRDEGIGIPASDIPHIFERFRRASNVATVQGTGIGLASAQQVVMQHGGSIGVISEEGRGSTFTVRLPLDTNGRE